MSKSTASGSDTTAIPAGGGATPRASLAVLGVKLRALDLFAPIRRHVHIPQKTIRYSPIQKLWSCFVGILAGAAGVADTERVLRADPVLQAAFGCDGCAEQSTLQDTLDACTPETIAGMEVALTELLRQFGHAARHDFASGELLLDIDLTGNPCGAKAACATKGYFAGKKNQRGRQVGRVLATEYNEVIADQLFPGTTTLLKALEPLVLAAEERLALTAEQRAQTIIRLDAGGGSVDAVNWLLERGYLVLCKDYSARRAAKLTESVRVWYPDAKEAGREVGWVTTPTTDYLKPVRRLAARYRKRSGQWGREALITNLPEAAAKRWVRHPKASASTASQSQEHGPDQAELLSLTHFYDQRGGGCETSFQGDKQGLGMTHRNKKEFCAQQMLMLLGALAHNVLVWAKEWLLPAAPRLAKYGTKRLVRDVLGILGRVEWGEGQRVGQIRLTAANPLARQLLSAFQQLVAATDVQVILGPP